MRLTKKKAIEISIELWTWLAETGEGKWDWEGWEKYEYMHCDCALCEYSERQGSSKKYCKCCPYYKKFGLCNDDSSPFYNWYYSRTEQGRKKYAKLFLEQLKEL